jgi:hypothetical protein
VTLTGQQNWQIAPYTTLQIMTMSCLDAELLGLKINFIFSLNHMKSSAGI